jgi:hypothetical protein
MVTLFNRTVFEPTQIKRMFSKPHTIPTYASNLIVNGTLKVPFSALTYGQVVYGLDTVIGSKATEELLKLNATQVIATAAAIFDDFMRPNVSDQIKDLQLTLLANCIMRIIKTTPMPAAAVDGKADQIIVACQFTDSAFKLLLRVNLFDRELIDQPFIQILYY